MTTREKFKNTSNNERNNLKNVCGLAVAEYLMVDNTVHYLHTINDLVRATRNGYTCRSRSSQVRGKSVGSQREKFAKLTEDMRGKAVVTGYIVRVKGHVLLLDRYGQTKVDTAPRKADRRKITHAYIVYTETN